MPHSLHPFLFSLYFDLTGATRHNRLRRKNGRLTNNSNCKILDSSSSLCQMTLPDWQAPSAAGSWLWYLSAYKKKYLCSYFPLWPQLFWFSKQQFFQRLHSFKGSQLGSDLPAGRTVYSFYSMLLTCPLYQRKKQPTIKTESCVSEENLKSKHSLVQWWNVLKMYQNPFKFLTWSLFLIRWMSIHKIMFVPLKQTIN